VKRLWPPLLALAFARALSAAGAYLAGVDPLNPNAWIRWDSDLYLSIAHRGYFLEQCSAGSHYEGWQWCGNSGWFPLYAWLLKFASGALLSLAFEAVLLYVIWRWLLREKSLPALMLAAVFPGGIYQQAVFPISLFLLCAVIFLVSERPEPAGLAAMAYPTGLLLVPVALVKRNYRAALVVAAGFIAVMAVMRMQTGHWNAYFLTQDKYAFHFAPFDTFFSRLKPLVNARYRSGVGIATALQMLLVVAMLGLGLSRWRTNPQIAAYSLAYWLFPLCVGGHIAFYRAESLLVPLVVLLPERARIPLLVCAALLFVPMAEQFFNGSLV
jgi:hypothetical protein